MFIYAWAVVLAALAGGAAGGGGAGGWLGRLVAYHKNKFMEEFSLLAPIQLQATVERAPRGYRDSPAWDAVSVARLLALMSASESARPARRALRRALSSTPSRRFAFHLPKQKSYKYFPSIAQMIPGGIFYDESSETEGEYSEGDQPGGFGLDGDLYNDTAVIRVDNPVEARLPSARISVRLLKDILEARGAAARHMPTIRTTKTASTTWRTIKTSAAATEPPPPSASDTASVPAKVTDPPPAAGTDPPPAGGTDPGPDPDPPPDGSTTPPAQEDTTAV